MKKNNKKGLMHKLILVNLIMFLVTTMFSIIKHITHIKLLNKIGKNIYNINKKQNGRHLKKRR